MSPPPWESSSPHRYVAVAPLPRCASAAAPRSPADAAREVVVLKEGGSFKRVAHTNKLRAVEARTAPRRKSQRVEDRSRMDCVLFYSGGPLADLPAYSKKSAFCANPDSGTRDRRDDNSGLCAVKKDIAQSPGDARGCRTHCRASMACAVDSQMPLEIQKIEV